LRGYEFSFELTAPIELHEMGYNAGFGEKNAAAGMGLVQVVPGEEQSITEKHIVL
jgi:CRISPR-associated endoribonuclease Cas6